MTENVKLSAAGTAKGAATRISIVIPALNQLDYTRGCLEQLKSDAAGTQLIVIDNGSCDGTSDFLARQENITVITNATNRGCAPAWNQGVQAASREWIVVLNNDVVTSAGWLEGLVGFAEEGDFQVATPAIREGPLNYSLPGYASEFVGKMRTVKRAGIANGICFMVRRDVFKKVGLFDENFRVGQFEDSDFFLRAKMAGFRLGTTGRAFLHHYGSITQNALRTNTAVKEDSYEHENRLYYRKKWGLNGPRRLWQRWRRQVQNFWWRTQEYRRHRHTLHEKWIDGRIQYF